VKDKKKIELNKKRDIVLDWRATEKYVLVKNSLLNLSFFVDWKAVETLHNFMTSELCYTSIY
jgi:hypothetical protein